MVVSKLVFSFIFGFQCQTYALFADFQIKYKALNGTAPASPNKTSTEIGSASGISAGIPSYIFAEKLVPVLVDLFLQAPAVEKYIMYPEIIQSLGR